MIAEQIINLQYCAKRINIQSNIELIYFPASAFINKASGYQQSRLQWYLESGPAITVHRSYIDHIYEV